jgi:hypothetical protein
MNTPLLTKKQYQRFEQHVAYARQEGAALYNAQVPEIILEGDDEVVEDAELIAACLLNRDDGYYTFTQHGWDYARYLHS